MTLNGAKGKSKTLRLIKKPIPVVTESLSMPKREIKMIQKQQQLIEKIEKIPTPKKETAPKIT
jgi:hypothetical protein